MKIPTLSLMALALANSVAAQIAPAGEAELDAYLRERVNAAQAALPRVVAEGMTMKSVTLNGRDMRYDAEIESLTPDEAMESVQAMAAGACSTVGVFIDRGVTYTYVYSFPKTGETRTMVLNRETCARR